MNHQTKNWQGMRSEGPVCCNRHSHLQRQTDHSFHQVKDWVIANMVNMLTCPCDLWVVRRSCKICDNSTFDHINRANTSVLSCCTLMRTQQSMIVMSVCRVLKRVNHTLGCFGVLFQTHAVVTDTHCTFAKALFISNLFIYLVLRCFNGMIRNEVLAHPNLILEKFKSQMLWGGEWVSGYLSIPGIKSRKKS